MIDVLVEFESKEAALAARADLLPLYERLFVVQRAGGSIQTLVPPGSDASPLTNRIDWYEEVVFQSSDMDAFIAEWELLEALTENPETHEAWEIVLTLAQRCRENPDSTLQFFGEE